MARRPAARSPTLPYHEARSATQPDLVTTPENTSPDNKALGVGIAIGMGVGSAMGVAMDNIALGTSLGLALGIALAVRLQKCSEDQ